ncbi:MULTISPECIES: DUF4870 domain-containing protein [Kytococcus]|uniref:DUF4870 domain-containing protein n=1 Tax=Kytococcus schroeteri TaxID=138300 RepID=A0A2I1PBA0_9MICO|nr:MULTISPECIES: DUF4870 domain-containing protein [Kytococcus]OFS16149.1 hypothetical protein HMPREF3099_00145 [Kytococcus sp. HMSC28H12]PKZ41902.1 DUF4870 domain-containing protein [Kytococcus schroeteri]
MTTPPPPPNGSTGPSYSSADSSALSGGSTPDDTFAGGGPRQGGPGQPGASGPGWNGTHAAAGQKSDSDRLVAMFCHLSGIISWVLSGGLLPFVGPLIVWLVYKDRDPFVRRAAAGSFNFHVVATIVFVTLGFGLFVVAPLTFGLALFLLVPLALLATGIYLWWTISATLKANHGEPYRYPVEIKILD